MATNIGIDFGSTYSMLSYYDESRKETIGIQSQDGSAHIPSVACQDPTGEGLVFGKEAQDALREDPTLQSYRAFKMLLHEGKPENYQKHGYTDRKPEEVSAEFLKQHLLEAADNTLNTTSIDNAVICVPEHWNMRCDQMSGRSILLNICRKIRNRDRQPLLKNIRVISEPVAATAYYAHCYWKKHESTPFEGDVLIVDYGGGTLDISLTTVKAADSAKGKMEIDVKYRTGVGENSEGKIGDAGLAYMERVIAIALEESGIRNIKVDGAFLNTKNTLERSLIRSTENIRKRIIQRDYASDMSLMASDHDIFTTVRYKGRNVSVTYAMLYKAYAEIVYPTLKKHLHDIKSKVLDKSKYPYRVAVVGGFGSYPLVQYAIWNLLGVTKNTADFTLDAGGGRQDAVSFGAALIAAGEIQVLVRSPYAMGLKTVGKRFRNAIAYRQPIPDRDEVYPVGGKWENPLIITESEDAWYFAVSNKDDPNEAIELRPVPKVHREIRNRLREAKELLQLQLRNQGIEKNIEAFYLGFSMDESCIYYLHFFAEHPETKERILDCSVKEELGNFLLLFGPTVSLTPRQDKENVLKLERMS